MANKSNIPFLVNCYDFANLREALIPLANGDTVGGHRHQGLLRVGERAALRSTPAARRKARYYPINRAGASGDPFAACASRDAKEPAASAAAPCGKPKAALRYSTRREWDGEALRDPIKNF